MQSNISMLHLNNLQHLQQPNSIRDIEGLATMVRIAW